jgi:sensor histidine kinase YesM
MISTSKRHWWVRLFVLLIFWTASYIMLLSIFATSASGWLMIDHIYTSIFIVTILVPVTVNDLLLVPKFLNKGKYAAYFALVILCTMAGAWLNHMLFSTFIDYILPGYYFISYYEYADLLKFFTVFVVAGTLITLSLEWFRLQEDRFRINRLEKEKVAAEFKALANQVNPHFLFNSLTVLYALAVKSSPDTPGAILKLSDILRYVIYQTSAATVSLRSEISLLKDFIDLQRHRIPLSMQIDFAEHISNEDVNVAPMLMLPLLENSFKHCTTSDQAFVCVKATEENGIFQFTIINHKATTSTEAEGGFGLKNLRERLQLAYPGRHSFDISQTKSTFTVTMAIDLK